MHLVFDALTGEDEMKPKVIQDMRTLKAMQRAGHLRFVSDESGCFYPFVGETGQSVRHWTGMSAKACYVDEPESGKRSFTYHGKAYRLEYISGCFYPFVLDSAPAA